MGLLEKIRKKAASLKEKPKIVFPELEDPRILRASREIKKFAEPVLLKNVNPDKYSERFYELRKHKGITLEDARRILKSKVYYGTMMVREGDADALISGSLSPTSSTLKPAFQILREGYASSFFIMERPGKVLIFADCAINPNPDSEELARIAVDTAKSAEKLGITPRVALLSFSTKGSARHEMVEKVAKASEIAKKLTKKSKYQIDGELQADAALAKEVAKIKAPKSSIAGRANVLIFPDLNSGNIGYKLVQRLGGYRAVGPVIQGLRKPVNDLSRGCSVQDIVDLAAVTSLQASK